MHDRLMAAKGALQKQHLATPFYLVSPQYVYYMLSYVAVWEYHCIVYCGIEQYVAVCSSR